MNDRANFKEDLGGEIAAWIGMDWSDAEHALMEYNVSSGKSESYTLKNKPESIQEWLRKLRERYCGSKVAVVLEQSRGPLLYSLMSCEFIVLYPVNPQALASY